MRKRSIIAVLCGALLLCSCADSADEGASGDIPVIEIEGTDSAGGDSSSDSGRGISDADMPLPDDKSLPFIPGIETEPLPTISDEALSEFDARVAEAAEAAKAVGISVAVFRNGEVFHTLNMGYADKEEGILCSDETVYRTASVSKLVSGVVLMTLYDKGLITPETGLEKLTGLPFDSPYYNTEVKLWHLMTHTAGLGDGKAYLDGPSKYYTSEYVLNASHTYGKPGVDYCYTNLGAGLFGALTEILTGEFFHDYAAEVLFEPLGMNAAYTADLLKDRSACSKIYSSGSPAYDPKTWYRLSGYYERFGLGNSYLSANCELLISATDLARVGVLLAGDGSVDGVRILSRKAVDEINFPRYRGEEYDMGLSVRIYSNTIVDGRTLYGHPGQALGNVCGLYYDPSDGTGIAIMTSGCSAGVKANGVYSIIDTPVKAAYELLFDK